MLGGGYLRSNGMGHLCCTITGEQILRSMCFQMHQACGPMGHIRAKSGFNFRGLLYSLPGCHISVKEMILLVIAAVVWGQYWRGLSVRFLSDNSAAVALLNMGAVRDDTP